MTTQIHRPSLSDTIYYGNPVNKDAPLNRGKVAWWLNLPLLKGRPKLTDLMGKYPGTLTNGPIWQGANGRPGGFGSVDFQATQYVNLLSLASTLGDKTKTSVASWVRANTHVNNSYIFSQSLVFGLKYDGSPGRYTTGVRGSTGSKEYEWGGCIATIGTWEHIVTTVDISTDTVAIYKNGLLVQTDNSIDLGTGFDPEADNACSISSSGSNLDAQLDDICFWIDYALSAKEVYALYQESKHGYPTTLNRLSRTAYFVGGAAPPAGDQTFNAAWASYANTFVGF